MPETVSLEHFEPQPEDDLKQEPGEASLPPEAQGELNGGPLGCCLGITVGLLLSLAVGVLSRLYADPLSQVFHSNLSLITRIVMGVLAVVGAIACGYYGWKVGRRLYREYDAPVVKERGRKAKPKTVKT